MDQQSIKDVIDSCIESLVDKMFLLAHDELDTDFNRNLMKILIINLRFGRYALNTPDMRMLDTFNSLREDVDYAFLRGCEEPVHAGLGLPVRDVWRQHLLDEDRFGVFASWINGTPMVDAVEQALHNRKAAYKKSIIDRIIEIDDPTTLFECWDIVKGEK